MNIELLPLKGIVLHGVPLQFGMEQSAVEAVIGPGQPAGTRVYYLHGELAIDYNADHRMEFIEFLGGIDGKLCPVLDGISIFDADAEEVYRLLKQKDGGEIPDPERGHFHPFSRHSMGIYRELTPEDVREMVAEMEADGIPTDNNSDLAADQRRAGHWATIGLGIAGYYDR